VRRYSKVGERKKKVAKESLGPMTLFRFFFLKVGERKPADWQGLFVPYERESWAISGALRPTFSNVSFTTKRDLR